jgi:hypothetical protein
MKRHKFTVIELIVICAIVMTLLSMVLSSVNSSKEMAIKATCMSNLGQIRVVTELSRKDNGKLPYSETWLTDFSYAADYLSGDELEVFKCPGSDDAEVNSASQLVSQTSYYYVPTYAQLEQHIADGVEIGITEAHLAALADTQDGAIYDKSADHHDGINITYLFKEEDTTSHLQGAVTFISNPDDLLVMSGDGFVDLPAIEDNSSNGNGNSNGNNGHGNNGHGNNVDGVDSSNPGNAPFVDSDPTVDDENGVVIVADVVEEVVADVVEEEIVAAVAEFVATDEGTIELQSDVTIKYEVLGAAISYGGQYDMAVTAQFNFSVANVSETVDPFGIYSDPVGSNLNSGNSASENPVSYDVEKVYPAGTEVSILAKSWKKTRSSKSGTKINHWRQYMEVNSMSISGSSSLSNVIMLVNGDEVPQIDGFLEQDNIVTFLDTYVTDGKISIGDDQVLVLFELGTTNLTSSAADFQDLVVLMTMFPAE